jgi:hypothetical protein
LTQAVQQKAREVVIRFLNGPPTADSFEQVKQLLEGAPGDCDVFIDFTVENMLVRVRAHPSLKIEGSAAIENNLRSLGCEVSWEGLASAVRAAAASN